MAAKKKSTKTTRKATATRAKSKAPPRKSKSKSKAKYVQPKDPILVAADPAHAPGHRRMPIPGGGGGDKVKLQPAARNQFANADRINRVTAQKRISGFSSSAGARRRKSLETKG